jgi:4-hydroxybenzoate polyprenyltransferase
MKRIRDPHWRFRFAVVLFVFAAVGWPATHILMLVTDPPENSWVFHVLMVISWLAILMTALDLMATTDVRKQHE